MLLLILFRCFMVLLIAEYTEAPNCDDVPQEHGNCNACGKQATCKNVRHFPKLEDHIQTVESSDNIISTLKRTSFSHNKYTKIHLRNNSISSIDHDTFVDLKKLQFLDLSNNQLRFLDKDIFESNKVLNNLYLEDNPDLHFDLENLPQGLERLNVLNTSTNISSNTLERFRNLHNFKVNLCVDDTCTVTREIEITHPISEKPHNSSENCNSTYIKDSEEEKVNFDTDYLKLEKRISALINTLEDLKGNIRDITEKKSKIEDVYMQCNNTNILLLTVNNNILKIHNDYLHIGTKVNELSVSYSLLKVYLVFFSILIIVLQIGTILFIFYL